jgi:hypothetical protein
MGLIGNFFKMPFKAVGDVFGGAFKSLGGVLKGLGNIAKVGLDIATLGLTGNPLTDAKKVFANAGEVISGLGQTARGGIGLAGTGAAILALPSGLGALGIYAGTTAAYTAMGG